MQPLTRTRGAFVVLAGAGLLGGGALVASPASAADYPPIPFSCSTDSAHPTPHSVMTVDCVGLMPRTPVQVTGHGTGGQPVGDPMSDEHGGLVLPVAVNGVGPGDVVIDGTDSQGAPVTTTLSFVSAQNSSRNRAGAVSQATVTPGQPFTFSGQGCADGTLVTVRDNDALVGTMTSADDGTFAYSLSIEQVGHHVLTATCLDPDGNMIVITAEIDVLDTSSSRALSGGALPFTGSDGILLCLTVGTGLVVAGSSFVLVGRRRS